MIVFLLMVSLVLSDLGTPVTAVVKTALLMDAMSGIYEQGRIDDSDHPQDQRKIYRYPRSPAGDQTVAQSEPGNQEPDAESQAKGEPEEKVTSEPAPESEFTNSSAETRPESSAAETVPETWPEAGPRWREAFKIWSWCWELHIYLFATLYLLIGSYGGYYVLANVYDGLMGKFLSVSLNVMVLLFGLTRAFVMYVDPYHQGGHIKAMLFMRVLWSIGGPCLMAADSAIILALVELAQVSIAPPRLQKLKTVSIIVGGHFGFVILTDCIVSSYMDAKAMLLFCQVFYIVWGSVLGTGYVRLGFVLDKKLFSHREKDKADKVYLALIYLSGAANYFLCGIVFYSAFSVFGVYADVDYVDAWDWWIMQTLLRVSEVITCVLIFTVSAKRSRVEESYTQNVNPMAPTSKPAWLGTSGECDNTACLQRFFVDEQTQNCKRKPRFILSLINYLQKYCKRRVVPSPNNAARESIFVMSESGASNAEISSGYLQSSRGKETVRTVTESSNGCQSLGIGREQIMDNIQSGGKPKERKGPRSRRRMSMFSALHSRANTPAMMAWEEQDRKETEGKLEVSVKAFVVPGETNQKDEDFRIEMISSRPRRTSMFSALHESITKLDKQQRDNMGDNEVMPKMEETITVLPNGGFEENVDPSQVGVIPKRDVKTKSEVNRAFVSLHETDEDALNMTDSQESNPARRNSLFSALQDSKVEATQCIFPRDVAS